MCRPRAHRGRPALARHDPRYQAWPPTDVPLAECLKDTVARFLPFWHETVVPALKSGQRVIIAAHGNSLRALVKYLDDMSDEDIVDLNIPTGIPLVYELDDDLRPIRHYYLGDPEAAGQGGGSRRRAGQEVEGRSLKRETRLSAKPGFF